MGISKDRYSFKTASTCHLNFLDIQLSLRTSAFRDGLIRTERDGNICLKQGTYAPQENEFLKKRIFLRSSRKTKWNKL